MGIYTDAIANKEIYYNSGAVEVDTSYKLGNGSHNVTISGNGTNISVGNGSSVIKHDGGNAVIVTGNGNQKITSTGSDKTIVSGSGDDEVSSVGDNVLLDVGDGRNIVKSIGTNCDIKTGGGNDNVTYVGDFVKADTGAGDDRLVFWGNYGTVNMGDGNDSAVTLDKVYQTDEYADLADDFLDNLDESTHENWTLLSRTLLGTKVKKKKSFCKTKVTTTFFFLDKYQVDTILSKHVNMKGTTIDMGSGSDSADVTLGNNSKIFADKSDGQEDSVSKTKKYSIDKVIDTRIEKITTVKKKTKKKTGWSAIGQMIAGAVIVVGSVIAGCFTGGAGWAGVGVGAAMLTGEGVAANGAREGSVHGGTGGQ